MKLSFASNPVHFRTILQDTWGYEVLLPQFESREDYYHQIMPKRIKLIQELIDEHSPRAVIG